MRSRLWALAALGVLIVGLAVRAVGFTAPPTDFHPTRQYAGALMARGFYLDIHGGTARQRAIDRVDRYPILEPPILETMVVAVDLVIGHETLATARAVSVIAWLIAGLALWRLARRFLDEPGATLVLAFFELLPLGVVASRSFQPDPLATALLVVALLAAIRWQEDQRRYRLLVAVSTAGAAIFVKPDLAPWLVLPAGAVLSQGTVGVIAAVRSLLRPHTVAYFAGAFCPALVWTLLPVGTSGSLASKASNYFVPRYLMTVQYLKSLGQINVDTYGPVLILAALAGCVLASKPFRRFLIAGLVADLTYSIAFNYRVATHIYYQLPAVPFVCLAAGAALERPLRWVSKLELHAVARASVIYGLIAAIVVGLAASDQLPSTAGGVEYIRNARVIGRLLCHPVHTILVAQAYGVVEQYYGEIGGVAWPSAADDHLGSLQGRAAASAEARLDTLREQGARYAIITDWSPDELPNSLRAALARFPVLAHGPAYEIRDLQPSLPGSCDGGPS